jgi:hypothetical protein
MASDTQPSGDRLTRLAQRDPDAYRVAIDAERDSTRSLRARLTPDEYLEYKHFGRTPASVPMLEPDPPTMSDEEYEEMMRDYHEGPAFGGYDR